MGVPQSGHSFSVSPTETGTRPPQLGHTTSFCATVLTSFAARTRSPRHRQLSTRTGATDPRPQRPHGEHLAAEGEAGHPGERRVPGRDGGGQAEPAAEL